MGFPAMTVLLVSVLVVVAEPRREIKYKIKKQDFLQRYQDENKNRTEENAFEICHKVALHRCGQNFMRAFNLVEYLSGADYYNTQCTLRKGPKEGPRKKASKLDEAQAFFACVDKLRQKPCRKRRTSALDDKRFRKKLADALWETRVCVLGIKDIDELPPKRKGLK